MAGVYHGTGKFTWEDNSLYDGHWKDGKQHGSGLYVNGDGVRGYVGEWQNGVKHGQGLQQLSDGRVFEGTFTDGLAGPGVLALPGKLAMRTSRIVQLSRSPCFPAQARACLRLPVDA